MGPGDPFAYTEPATGPREGADAPFASPDRAGYPFFTSAPLPPSRRVALFGFILGALFGVAVLLGLVFESLFVLFSAGMGGGLAWLLHGLLSGRLHPGQAWRALRGF